MAFYEISREVVDRFLQSVIFVDEKAYGDVNDSHAFDAQAVTTAFAHSNKLCSVFAPVTVADVENCFPILTKADAIVLDWYLELRSDEQENEVENSEEDEEHDDPRGAHTLEIIRRLAEDAGSEKMKLIIVYTSEVDLEAITQEIAALLADKGYEMKECQVCSKNVNILIRAKQQHGEANQYQYNQRFLPMVCAYEQLPELILTEYVNTVSGFLPNYALEALTSIRESTSKILNVFSKDLDAAYLGHCASVPHKEDAYKLLNEIFGTSVKELLEERDIVRDEWIDAWIDDNISDEGWQVTLKQNIQVTKERLKEVLHREGLSLNARLKEVFQSDKKKEEQAIEIATNLFVPEIADRDIKFAELTQMRNPFGLQNNSPRRLNQGTIVESGGKYWVCVQPRCDVGRIRPEGEGVAGKRKFLFLPLKQEGNGVAVVVDGAIMHVDTKSYHVEQFEFSTAEGENTILFALDVDGNYKKTDMSGNVFVWKAELKELQAQRVNTHYSDNISRVGLDESEWLRIKGKS